jgi:hypothetical protein
MRLREADMDGLPLISKQLFLLITRYPWLRSPSAISTEEAYLETGKELRSRMRTGFIFAVHESTSDKENRALCADITYMGEGRARRSRS